MTHHINLGTATISVIAGAAFVVQDIPGLEIADRIGMAGTAVMVVWWMLSNFSKRLDKLTEAIERLSERSRDK